MVNLIEHTINHIAYTKENASETSERYIIPMAAPTQFVKAIDVTGIDSHEAKALADNVQEYAEYRRTFLSNMLTYERWVEHTTNVAPTIKWRTFKCSGIQTIS